MRKDASKIMQNFLIQSLRFGYSEFLILDMNLGKIYMFILDISGGSELVVVTLLHHNLS